MVNWNLQWKLTDYIMPSIQLNAFRNIVYTFSDILFRAQDMVPVAGNGIQASVRETHLSLLSMDRE